MFVEHWIEHSRSNLAFEQPRLPLVNNFIFRKALLKGDVCSLAGARLKVHTCSEDGY